ncbi:MAG: class I SAM-dependent methyltransferase [Planctomycetes bacterium]|jgi:SAM-dependent methyltransferase|nr:class I SAM-dependent methyltransferase [Planctomycetota bacterium]
MTRLALGRTIKDRMEIIGPLVRGRKTLDLGVVDSRRGRQGTAERLEKSPGSLFRRIGEINPDTVGIDIDEDGVEILRRQGFHTRTADVITMDLGERYDVIVAGEIIEHLPNPGQFLANMARHLTPGGTLVLTTPNPFYVGQVRKIWRHGRPQVHEEHVCWFDPITLCRLCRVSGLDPYGVYWIKSAGHKAWKTWPRLFRGYFSESFMLLAHPVLTGE